MEARVSEKPEVSIAETTSERSQVSNKAPKQDTDPWEGSAPYLFEIEHSLNL